MSKILDLVETNHWELDAPGLNFGDPAVDDALLPYVRSVVSALQKGLQVAVSRIEVRPTHVRATIYVRPPHQDGAAFFVGHPLPGYLELPGSAWLPSSVQIDLPAGLLASLQERGQCGLCHNTGVVDAPLWGEYDPCPKGCPQPDVPKAPTSFERILKEEP